MTSWLTQEGAAGLRSAMLAQRHGDARFEIELDQGESFADDLFRSLNADIARLRGRRRLERIRRLLSLHCG